jgi:uncharacterized protein (PEP-CTERM system associated)
MYRTRRSRAARPARWTAGLVALSSSLIGDFTRAADHEPVAAPQQALVLQPSLELQETYTDNVALTAHDKVSDLITRAVLSIEATLDTGRAEGHADANVGYDVYARQSARSGWYAAGNGAASYALLPNLLTLKADASTSAGAISTFGLSATDRHGAPNLAQLTTYDVGPEFTGHTPDGLDVRAAARFAQVLYSNASSGPLLLPRDDSVVQLTWAVASDATRRLQLESSGEYLRDAHDFTSVSDIQSAFFRVGGLRLIGRVGYDDITQGQLLHISAPLASAGFEYRPNGSSTITVEAGSRYHRAAWAANATMELSPHLLATASYVEQVQPDQVGVARSFFAFTEAAQNLPPPLVPTSFGVPADVTNATSLCRSATFRGVYHDEVNTLGVTADWTDREFLTVPGRDRTLLVDAVFTRRVRPDLTLVLRAEYAHTPKSPTYGPSQTVGGSVQLAYRLNSRTDVTLNLSRTQSRQLVQGGKRVTENALFQTLRRAF